MSDRRKTITAWKGQLFAFVLFSALLVIPGCFTSELPPGFQVVLPDNGGADETSTQRALPDTTSEVVEDIATTSDEFLLTDGSDTDSDPPDTPPFRFLDAQVFAETADGGSDGETEGDITPTPPDAPSEVTSTTDGENGDAVDEVAEDISQEDCPTCEGSPAPTWALEDFQPASSKIGQIYGLDTFKGRVVVLALLAGW